MNRLLNKTLLYFTLIAILLLIASAPLFYWMMESLYHEDVDETIRIREQEFKRVHLPSLTNADIAVWNRFNRDIQILDDTVRQQKEKIISRFFLDSIPNEVEPYHVLYADVDIQYKRHVLMVRIDLVESEDLMKTLTGLYLGILFILLSVLFLITRLLSKHLWKPFYDTLNRIDHFHIEQHTAPKFSSTSIEEFKQLNIGLNKLIDQNVKAYKSQKEFAENASHELQTPLAVFRSKLDLLFQEPNLTERQVTIISSLYDACSRLIRINKNLLLLSKIENKQFQKRDKVNIVQLIVDVFPYFEGQAEARNVKMEYDLHGNGLIIDSNRGLTEILVHNLLLNAIRHNREMGMILVQMTENELIISNTGADIPLITETLFKRFSKTSEHAHSSGLGLAIVFEICQLHHWQVSYHFREEKHIFSIAF